MDTETLIRAALDARQRAYAPYSGYAVGAALLCINGDVYTGCNIENAAYSVCNCAERTALFAAIAGGQREFTAIAVVGGAREEQPPLRDYAHPCGVCRQALREFAPDLHVIVAKAADDYKEYSLRELLLESFGPDNLGR